VATSRAVPDRQIGQADGLDRVFLGYFAKKTPQTLAKSTRSSTSSLNFYCKKNPRTFQKTTRNPAISMGRPSVALGQPAFRVGRAIRRVA
jgi:hypothetical protein